MKQSETPHALKHRIEELEEENKALMQANLGIDPKAPTVQIRGKNIRIATLKTTKGEPMDPQSVQALVINQRGSDMSLTLDIRRGGSLNNRGFWLGRQAYLGGTIPEVRRDDQGDYVLMFIRQ